MSDSSVKQLMRVLFWTGGFWPNIGGVEVLATRVLPALKCRGYEFVIVVPQSRVPSRPEEDFGKPATKWGYTVDWRRPVLQEVSPFDVNLSFGDGEWGRRLEGFGFTPVLAFYAPSCIGRIHEHIGDVPYVAAGTGFGN